MRRGGNPRSNDLPVDEDLDPWAEQLALRMRARFRQQPPADVAGRHVAELQQLQDELYTGTAGPLRIARLAAVACLFMVAAVGASLFTFDRETKIASTGRGAGGERTGQVLATPANSDPVDDRQGESALGDVDRRRPEVTTRSGDGTSDPASPTTDASTTTTSPAATSATTTTVPSGSASPTTSPPSMTPSTAPPATVPPPTEPPPTKPSSSTGPSTTRSPKTTAPAITSTTTGVTCGGRPATIVGTTGDDVLRGTEGPDVIVGLAGHDRIEGLGGDDVICGRKGADELYGGSGDDEIYGGDGRDLLVGGPGVDFLDGGNGTDKEIQDDL